jgi:Protein of unknown function (DUF2782)
MSLARTACLCFAVLAAAPVAYAQAPPPPPPPSEAQTAPPAPPPDASDPDLEPQITIIRRETDVIEEVRIKGELRYVRVTPRFGRPYFLIPDGNGQTFLKRDSLDIGLKVPMWVLFSF